LNGSYYVKVKQGEQYDKLPNSLQHIPLSKPTNSQRQISHSFIRTCFSARAPVADLTGVMFGTHRRIQLPYSHDCRSPQLDGHGTRAWKQGFEVQMMTFYNDTFISKACWTLRSTPGQRVVGWLKSAAGRLSSLFLAEQHRLEGTHTTKHFLSEQQCGPPTFAHESPTISRLHHTKHYRSRTYLTQSSTHIHITDSTCPLYADHGLQQHTTYVCSG
jgi:hypothetical protein